MPTPAAYIQVGDHNSTLWLHKDQDADAIEMLDKNGRRWTPELKAPNLIVLRPLRDSDKNRGSVVSQPAGDRARIAWGSGTLPGLLPGQRVVIKEIETHEEGLSVWFERPLALAPSALPIASPAPARVTPIGEMRAKLRDALDIINEAKAEMGDDLSLRITTEGTLRLTFIMEV